MKLISISRINLWNFNRASKSDKLGIIVIFSILAAITLGLVAAYQLIGVSRDYEYYLIYFSWVEDHSYADLFLYRFEPLFALVTYALTRINLDGPEIYFCFAAFSIFLKTYALRVSKNFVRIAFIFLIYYLLRYFTLFEMTVLRAAVAASLAFFIFYRRTSYKIKISELTVLSLAALMHYSAILFIFVYIFSPKNRYASIIMSIAVFISIYIVSGAAITFLAGIIPVFETYKDFNQATLIPITVLVDIIYLVFMLYLWDRSTIPMKISTSAILLSMAFHFSLIQYSLIAARLRELLSIFILIHLLQVLKIKLTMLERGFLIIFFLFSGAVWLVATYFYDPLLL